MKSSFNTKKTNKHYPLQGHTTKNEFFCQDPNKGKQISDSQRISSGGGPGWWGEMNNICQKGTSLMS